MAGGVIVATKLAVSAVFTLYLFSAISMSGMAGGLLGFDNGVTGGVLAHPDFEERFMRGHGGEGPNGDTWCRFADIKVQLFTASLFLTGIIGALIGMRLCDSHGRRLTMSLGGILFFAGSVILSTTFSGGWTQLVIGRLILGFGVGLATMATPLYMAELTPPQWRGAANIVFQLCVTMGILMAQLITFYTASLPYGWRISMGSAGLPAFLLVLSTIFLPESPQWLMMKGRTNEAKAVLQKVYGVEDVSIALDAIHTAVESRLAHPNGLRLLFTRRYLPQLAMSTIIPAAQQLTGINAIMFYAPQVFLATGASTSNALLSSVIIGLVNVAAIIVAILAVDRLGRRFLLLQGGAQMVVTQIAVAMLLRQTTSGAGTSPAIATALVAMICLYVAAFAWSWGPLGWLVPTEVQPLETRTAGTAVNTIVNFAFTFVIGQVFLSMLCGLKWGVFLFFAGCVAVACVFIALALPETKGLTTEGIQEAFEAHKLWGPIVKGAKTEEAVAAKAAAAEKV